MPSMLRLFRVWMFSESFPFQKLLRFMNAESFPYPGMMLAFKRLKPCHTRAFQSCCLRSLREPIKIWPDVALSQPKCQNFMLTHGNVWKSHWNLSVIMGDNPGEWWAVVPSHHGWLSNDRFHLGKKGHMLLRVTVHWVEMFSTSSAQQLPSGQEGWLGCSKLRVIAPMWIVLNTPSSLEHKSGNCAFAGNRGLDCQVWAVLALVQQHAILTFNTLHLLQCWSTLRSQNVIHHHQQVPFSKAVDREGGWAITKV